MIAQIIEVNTFTLVSILVFVVVIFISVLMRNNKVEERIQRYQHNKKEIEKSVSELKSQVKTEIKKMKETHTEELNKLNLEIEKNNNRNRELKDKLELIEKKIPKSEEDIIVSYHLDNKDNSK